VFAIFFLTHLTRASGMSTFSLLLTEREHANGRKNHEIS